MPEERPPPRKPVLSFEVDDVIELDEVSMNLTPETGSPRPSARPVLTFEADQVMEFTDQAIPPDETPTA